MLDVLSGGRPNFVIMQLRAKIIIVSGHSVKQLQEARKTKESRQHALHYARLRNTPDGVVV